MDKVHNPIWKVTGEDCRQWLLKHLPEVDDPAPNYAPWSIHDVLVHDGRVSGYLDFDHLPRGPRVREPLATDETCTPSNGSRTRRPAGQRSRM